MKVDRIVELLTIEHQCMLRKSHNGCDGRCEACELVQDDAELHEMYTQAIAMLTAQEPVEPVIVYNQYECGVCMYELRQDADSFCPCCGKKVKWP